MKHAGAAALDRLEGLLAAARASGALKEKGRGVFYLKSRAFQPAANQLERIGAVVHVQNRFFLDIQFKIRSNYHILGYSLGSTWVCQRSNTFFNSSIRTGLLM